MAAAKTTVKVATLSAAAKDDIGNLTLTSLSGNLAVLANDPGAAKLWSVFTSAGGMSNGVTSTANVAHVTTATTAKGGMVRINLDGTLTYTAPTTGAYAVTAAAFTLAGAGEVVLTDSFAYVAQMADGAMSLANVVFTIKGLNDVALIGGDDLGSVVEDSQAVDTGALTITDADHDQSLFTAKTYAAAHGTLAVAAGGGWTYTLTSHSLWGAESTTDTIAVTSVDGTTHNVTIQIQGADDAATFTGDDTGSATEDSGVDATGTLVATDLDHDQSSMTTSSSEGDYGTLTMGADGKWTYALGAAAQGLGEGDTDTDTFTVTSKDGTEHQVVITVTGVNDAAVIGGDGAGSVVEDTQSSDTGSLTISDDDTGEAHFVGGDSEGDYGKLTLESDGDWSYSLGAAAQALWEGEAQTDTFEVVSADGTTASITIQITGTNDDAEFSGDDSGAVTEDTSPSTSGTLVADDADHDQSSLQALSQSGNFGDFSMGTDGAWTYALGASAQGLVGGQEASDTFTVLSLDGTAHDVVISITGTNDGASISGNGSGSVTEDSADNPIGGKLDVSDADTGEAAFTMPTNGALHGTYGTFTFDADGTWSYTLDNAANEVQALNDGDVKTDTLSVSSLDGTAFSTVTVTINGVTDNLSVDHMVNHGLTDINGKKVFTDFDFNDRLLYAGSYDYVPGATHLISYNGIQSTELTFDFTSNSSKPDVIVVLVGYTAFSAAQLGHDATV